MLFITFYIKMYKNKHPHVEVNLIYVIMSDELKLAFK